MRFELACTAALLVMVAAIVGVPSGGGVRAQFDDYPANGRYCTGTATAMFEACRSEGEPAHWKAVAACTNIDDDDERAECFDEASAERREGAQLCRSQLIARRNVCDGVGENRYDEGVTCMVVNDKVSENGFLVGTQTTGSPRPGT